MRAFSFDNFHKISNREQRTRGKQAQVCTEEKQEDYVRTQLATTKEYKAHERWE